MGMPAVKDWRELLKFRCTGCGNCCKGTIVMLTDHDVRRIVEGTGIAPREFVRFFGEDEIKLAKRHPFWIRFANRRATHGSPMGTRAVLLPGQRRSMYDL